MGFSQVNVNTLWNAASNLGITNDVCIDKVEGNYYQAGHEDNQWSLTKYDQIGTPLWRLNDFTSEFSEISKIVIGDDGNVFVSGYFKGTSSFPTNPDDDTYEVLNSLGESDAFAACYSPDGALVWKKSYGRGSYDLGMGLTILDNHLFVIIVTKSDGTEIASGLPVGDGRTKMILT